MKSLRHYLTESVRTYRYTIKIAGDIDKNFVDMFRYNLNKFDPVSISDAKSTPVQKDPYGFPDLVNQSVNIIKAEFKYPATEPMIQQIAQLLGKNINSVRVITTDFNDSINSENDKYANQVEESPLLDKTEMSDNGKEASKEYANQYLDKVLPKTPSIDIPYSATKTPTAPNKSKENIQTQSPMSKINRPPKPSTGAKK
jgi:ABC-type Na+ efflux pump permease subunit